MKKSLIASILFAGAVILYCSMSEAIPPAAPQGVTPGVVDYTVGTLPSSPAVGDVVAVSDGSTASDCTVGTGSTYVLCVYTAGGWVAFGDGTGGAGTGSVTTVELGDATVDATVISIDFNASAFDVTESPEDEVNVSLDLTPSSGNATLVLEEDALQVKYDSTDFSEGTSGLTLATNPTVAGDISVGDDLLLTSSGAIINFYSGDITITHGSETLTFAGGTYTFTGSTAIANALTVGTNDTTVGTISAYGGGVGADGGVLNLYLGADDDTSISHFQVQIVEDDLLIGPNTDTDALKLDAAKDFHVTAGSLYLPASEKIDFGGGDVTLTNSSNALALAGGDLLLSGDSIVLKMGADSDVTVTHVADTGINLKQAGLTTDDKPVKLVLQTGEVDIALNDVLGGIYFQAPDEGTGTDAVLVAAGIEAVSEGDFSASSNATKLSFKTGASETATEKMSLSSAGALTVTGDITVSGGNINTGNIALVVGDGTTDTITFTTDGTGEGEVELPDDSIGDEEIDWSDVTCADMTTSDCGAITSTGTITSSGTFDVTGGVGMVFGSADVTSFTFSGISETLIMTPSENLITFTTGTGVLTVDFGEINLATDALDLSEGNITNAGDIQIDSITADGTNVLFGSAAATQLQIRDTAIYIASLNDGYLDLEADTGIRMNGPVSFANEGELRLPSSNASPDTTGELRHDSVVSGVTNGMLEYHDGTNVRYLVDLTTLPSDDDYVVAYDADNDVFYMKVDQSAGAPSFDTVGDPEAAVTLSHGDTETITITTAQNTAGSFLIVDNTVADVTNDVYLFEGQYTDDDDANAFFLKFSDNNGAEVEFSVGPQGVVSIGEDPADAGTIRLPNTAVIAWEDGTEATITHVDNTGLAFNLGIDIQAGGITLANDETITNATDGTISFSGKIEMDGTDPHIFFDETDGTDWYLGTDDTGNTFEFRTNATIGNSVILEISETGTGITIGDDGDDDIAITFHANGDDGLFTWMEDEQYFKFSDHILMDSGVSTYYRDTAIQIGSGADGYLDLEADTGIRFNAPVTFINEGAITLPVGTNFADTAFTDLSNGGTYTNFGAAGDDTLDELFAAIDTAIGAKVGDVTKVGTCESGDCLDGSSDGGTTISLYDGNSHKLTIDAADLTGDATIVFGSDTNNITIVNGTASIDIAAAAVLNIDKGLQVTTNAGTIAFTAESKTLSVEGDSTVNQDLTTDASVVFGAAEINGTVTLANDETITNAVDGTVLVTGKLATTDDFTVGGGDPAMFFDEGDAQDQDWWIAIDADQGASADDDLKFGIGATALAANTTRLALEGTAATGTMVLYADDASYLSIAVANAGGVTINQTSDGTASVTFSDPVTLSSTLAVADDTTIYNDVNDGNPIFALGSSAAERLSVTATYEAGGKLLESVTFATVTEDTDADDGEMIFSVDGTTILTVNDGGLVLGASLAIEGTTAITLGAGTETVAVNSSDWDIDATGAITGVSFDVDGTGNSLANIVNANIKASAAIDATKIGAGGVTSTEFGYIGTLTSDVQTQISNILDGTTGFTKATIAEMEYTGATLTIDVIHTAASTLAITNSNVTHVANVTMDGDLTVTGGDITLGTTSIFSGGDTASLNNIDALDSTTETTIEAAMDTLANVTTVGGASANSITIYAGANDQDVIFTVDDGGTNKSVTIDGSESTVDFGADNLAMSLKIHDAGIITMYDDGDDTSVVIGPVADGTTTLGLTGSLTASATVTAEQITSTDDIALSSDSAILRFGADGDATDAIFTHVADTGLNFNDSLSIADDQVLTFGGSLAGYDWSIQYDETGGADQLLLATTATSATATTDPMFQILVGGTPTADQQVFGVAKGTQASNTDLLTLDEDGDLVIGGGFTSNASGDSYLQLNSNAASVASGNRLYFVSNELRVSEDGDDDVVLTQDDGATLTGTTWSFLGVTNLVLPSAAADASGEISMSTGNQLKWHDGTKVVTIDTTPTTDNYVLKYDNATATFTLEADETGGTPAWSTVDDPTEDVTIDHNAGEETNFTFTGDYTTGTQFLVQQLTGNPSGGVLFEARAADSDTVVARFGDGTNYWSVSTAGVLSNSGTATINAAAASDILVAGGQIDYDDLAGAGNAATSGTLTVSNTTEATGTGAAAVMFSGGLGVAKDVWVGDDVVLDSDGAVIQLGADQDVKIVHVADSGVSVYANSEDLILAATENTWTFSSSTGVTIVDFGTLNLGTDALDLSEGSITNVADIAVNSISDNDDDGMTIASSSGTVTVESVVFTGANMSSVGTLGLTGGITISANESTFTHSGTTSFTLTSTSGTVIVEGITFTGDAVTGASNITSADLTSTDDVIVGDDLLFASTGVINFDSSDVTITHSANTLTLAGGNLVTSENAATFTHSGTTSFTLTSTSGTVIVEGITFTGDAVTGASSISSTAFVGGLTGNADTATTGTNVVITDNESTAEANTIAFVADADVDGSTSIGLESDGDFTYNPSTGTVSATIFTAGTSVITPLIDAAGDEDMDYGSADVDDHTFTSDGGTVILDGTIVSSSNITIGNDTDGADYVLTFDGNAGNLTQTWMEDEHELRIADSTGEDLTIDLDTTVDNEIAFTTQSSATAINASSFEFAAKIGIISGTTNYTLGTNAAREAYGYLVMASGGAWTLTLPAVVQGMSVCMFSVDATAKTIDPNGSDGIINAAARDTDGHYIVSGGSIGDFVCLVGDSADGWTVLGKSGTWTSE